MTIFKTYIMYFRILTFRMFSCSRLIFTPSKPKKGVWLIQTTKTKTMTTKTTTIHRLIVLLQHYKSIRLSIIFFIDLLKYNYLSPKARRKWSIRCSGRTRVISHFTNRHIFVTYCDTIALFRKITIYTTRPTTIYSRQSYTNYITYQ